MKIKLKKALLGLLIVIFPCFTAISQKENSVQVNKEIKSQSFDGTWQIHVNLKEKAAFQSVKNSVIEEVFAKVSQNREANIDSSLNVQGYKVVIMSEEKMNKGLKWPQIQYIN